MDAEQDETIKKYLVTLELHVDTQENEDPSLWNWPILLDIGSEEDVRVRMLYDAGYVKGGNRGR